MSRAKGKYGEELAKYYLEQKGYQILSLNYRTYFGEIDIIAKDSSYVVFIEVKLRTSCRYGLPSESVTKAKQVTIYNVALHYISNIDILESDYRFDVIEFIKTDKITIRHIKNAF